VCHNEERTCYKTVKETTTTVLVSGWNLLTRQIVGALIALFERAVGFYASLVGINAYHQPGVEAGKKAAAAAADGGSFRRAAR
jgi:glucose-6-phosphate isomerase